MGLSSSSRQGLTESMVSGTGDGRNLNDNVDTVLTRLLETMRNKYLLRLDNLEQSADCPEQVIFYFSCFG